MLIPRFLKIILLIFFIFTVFLHVFLLPQTLSAAMMSTNCLILPNTQVTPLAVSTRQTPQALRVIKCQPVFSFTLLAISEYSSLRDWANLCMCVQVLLRHLSYLIIYWIICLFVFKYPLRHCPMDKCGPIYFGADRGISHGERQHFTKPPPAWLSAKGLEGFFFHSFTL